MPKRLIKLDTNTFLIQGPSHANGGVKLAPNVEAEGGEVVRVLPNKLQILSKHKLGQGKSPAQNYLNGLGFNTAFNLQEGYKQMNRINDDGSKYRKGGENYITKLGKNDERKFQRWYSTVAEQLGLDPNPDGKLQAYDYRGYWKEHKRDNMNIYSGDFHFTDKYKQPHHPTFSDESKYAKNIKGVGHWEGETFIPGDFNRLMQASKTVGDNVFNGLQKEVNQKIDELSDNYGIGEIYTGENPMWKKFTRDDVSDETKEKYYDVVRARYEGLLRAMRRKGFSSEDATRLARSTVKQLTLEAGWVGYKDDHNYGGMKRSVGNQHKENLKFNSDEEFYDAYLNNLDDKWGDARLGKGKGWRNAVDTSDFARIVNHEDLGLHTEEAFNEYNRQHPNNPVYLYTPEWTNGNTSLSSKLAGYENRANYYLNEYYKDRTSKNNTTKKSRGGMIYTTNIGGKTKLGLVPSTGKPKKALAGATIALGANIAGNLITGGINLAEARRNRKYAENLIAPARQNTIDNVHLDETIDNSAQLQRLKDSAFSIGRGLRNNTLSSQVMNNRSAALRANTISQMNLLDEQAAAQARAIKNQNLDRFYNNSATNSQIEYNNDNNQINFINNRQGLITQARNQALDSIGNSLTGITSALGQYGYVLDDKKSFTNNAAIMSLPYLKDFDINTRARINTLISNLFGR